MKILIDARMYGLEHAGIGRYVENLINQLQQIDKDNFYLILSLKSQKSKVKSQNDNLKFKIIETDVKHYTISEQIEIPRILKNIDFEFAHFPHFNAPLFFNKPYVVTIHDLIKHTFRGTKTTTHNPLFYLLKYAGYKKVFAHAVNASRKIIVPSNAVKNDLLNTYKIPSDKVTVTYEGVDEVFSKTQSIKYEVLSMKYKIKKPYVIYVGSVYPHKNIERLIESLKIINQKSSIINLVIVSARNTFISRLQQYIQRSHTDKFINLLGFVPDEEIAVLYKNAKAFVFPSLSEGFGLPALEAMAAGCLVVCSDIPVFHEIYGDAAVYFNPHDINDIAEKIDEVLRFNVSIHQSAVAKGKARVRQFSWRRMAEETLKVYNELV